MSKEELIKRLETLDAMAAKVAEECLPHESCEVFVTPLAVMYRMRDVIRCQKAEIETLRERLRKDEAALQGNITIFCDLKNQNEELRDALRFIAENGGKRHNTEYGSIACDGGWCAEQARSALYSYSANAQDEGSAPAK